MVDVEANFRENVKYQCFVISKHRDSIICSTFFGGVPCNKTACDKSINKTLFISRRTAGLLPCSRVYQYIFI